MKLPILLAAWVFTLLASATSFASTMANEVPLSAMRHDTWSVKQGAPRAIHALAQTSDGWIWIGTPDGLFRFDGVKFYSFVGKDGERPQDSISAFWPDDKGNLYIGYGNGGLSVVSGSQMKHLFTPKEVNTIRAFSDDASGAIWMATNSGIRRYANGKLESIDTKWGLPATGGRWVHRDRFGRIWAASKTQIFLYNDTLKRFDAVRPTDGQPTILDGRNGEVWTIRGKEVSRLPAPDSNLTLRPDANVSRSTFQTVFDQRGNIWTGNCPLGICRIPAEFIKEQQVFSALHAPVERLDQAWQLSSVAVTAMMKDREGNIWAGTLQGLERFRQQEVNHVAGLPDQVNLRVGEDHLGTIWAAAWDMSQTPRLWKMEHGRAVEQANPRQVSAVGTAEGALLLAGAQGVERRSKDGSTFIPPPDVAESSLRSINWVEEHNGVLWLSLYAEGWFRRDQGKWIRTPFGEGNIGHSLAIDRENRIWMAYSGSSLRVLVDGRSFELGASRGIGIRNIRFIDTEGDLLISGSQGLQVWNQGRFRFLRLEDGGESPWVSGIVAAADGARWLNTQTGLLYVAAGDWKRSANDPGIPLRAKRFDESYSYPGGSSLARRSAFQAKDGAIWLTSVTGLARVVPEDVKPNPLPPSSMILGLQDRHARYTFDEIAALAPGTQELSVSYTALSYRTPERLTFRYRLHGADREWHNAGSRREAMYTNLGPGTYRFEVLAVNDDGLAGAPVQSPAFDIHPTFVQSSWFIMLVAVGVITLLVLLYRFRTQQLTRRMAERTRAQLDERERIARTLHDSFLQSIQGLLLRIQAAALRLPAAEPVRGLLETALEAGDRTLSEGRDQVWGLRSELPHDADLTTALQRIANEVDSSACSIKVTGSLPELDCSVASEIFAIIKEAISNALRHSGASTIEVRLTERSDLLQVSVADNGCGMDADGQFLSPPGHFGLLGMRERAERISGHLDLSSQKGAGTVMTLTLKRSMYERFRNWLAARSI